MGQYKVLQDIEAEDKLLGPLSLRQFIYAAITIVLGFITFRLSVVGAWFVAIPLLPPALFFGLLAAPIGGDQSSEVWLLAKIRFFVKPKRRIWDQDGIEQLVTITVPKKVNTHTTKDFSEDEVSSRLKALAATLDTRGWAVKNVSSSMYGAQQDSDRLLDIGAPMQVVETQPDILDPLQNPSARRVEQLIDASTQAHRQDLLDKMNASRMQTERLPGIKPLHPDLRPQDDTPKPVHHSTPATHPHKPSTHHTTRQPALDQYAPTSTAVPRPVPKPVDTDMGYQRPVDMPPARTEPVPMPPVNFSENSQAQAVTTSADPDILKLVHDDNHGAHSGHTSGQGTDDSSHDGEVVISLH